SQRREPIAPQPLSMHSEQSQQSQSLSRTRDRSYTTPRDVPVEIRLEPGEHPAETRTTEQRRDGADVGGVVRHDVADTGIGEGGFAALPHLLLGGFDRKLEPRIAFGEKRIHIGAGPYPRRVPHLQIETPAAEHRGEVELPVEEALPLRHLLSHLQPRAAVE